MAGIQKSGNRKTVFDDAFRTMVQKYPAFVVYLINEMFGASYTVRDINYQRRNEFVTESGKIITDSIFSIGNELYHIECQSTDDKTMAIRMFSYDIQIAEETAERSGYDYEINIPHSCVVYIRDFDVPPMLNVKVNLPNGTSCAYECKTVKTADYDLDEIFEKKLLLFLPYYLMKYEGDKSRIGRNRELLNRFREDVNDIQTRLLKMADDERNNALYIDMEALIESIVKHIFGNEAKASKEVKNIMGGKVLTLPSEKLIADGRAAGRSEGRKEGQNELVSAINRLKAGETVDALIKSGVDADTAHLAKSCL